MSDHPSLAERALALRLEQARRWRNHERAPAEEYLARDAELSANPEYALEIVYGELLLREEEGERLQVEEFQQRFPQFASQVRRLFDVHRAVLSACLADSRPAELARQDTPSEFGGVPVPPGPTLPGYEIREELGRGGMGVILVCRDNPLSRDLAVKVLRQEHRGNAGAEQRFLAEAQITGQLQHPGVVPVHQVGRLADGRPYFTMKLVRGQTLATLLAARAAPGQEQPRWLAIFDQVCQTLAFAHDRGVVHRDLKPANVMVGAFNEVQVMDWGLAKVLASGGYEPPGIDEDRRVDTPSSPETFRQQTRAGDVLGTPAYMAPEQARGEVDRLDERCDVFGLGAILCEILTGQPPYGGVTLEEVSRQARQGDLKDAQARLEGCGADAELVQLAQRCLATDPAERPRDAGEVARAVTAHLTSVQERLRQAEVERAAAQARARAERKARRWTVVGAAAVLAVVLLGGGAWWWWHQRAAAATGGVELLLQQIEPLMREGNWPEALAVARQANALLATGGVPAELQQRVREHLADAEMVVGLEERLGNLKRKKGHYQSIETTGIYAEAFRHYGIDVEALEPAEAAERIRQSAIRDYLLVTLEYWARVPRFRERLLAIIDQAAPEDIRALLRATRDTKDRQTVQKLADSIDVNQHSPLALLQLSTALERAGDPAIAVSLLRRAQRRYPGDFRITYQLVTHLQRDRSPQRDEVETLRLASAALALRSRNVAMHISVGYLLEATGHREKAIAVYRECVRLEPEFEQGVLALGEALDKKGELGQAIAVYRDALRRRPEVADYQGHLGHLLCKKDLWDDAVSPLQEACRLGPEWAEARFWLGLALLRKGRLDEAVATFKKAITLKRDWADAYYFLGVALREKGLHEEEITALQEACRLKPSWPEAHNLLGFALRDQGDFTGSLAAFRQGHARSPKDTPEAQRFTQLVRAAERQVELDAKLPGILRGAAQPADAGERIELAHLCTIKKLPGTAARFFAEAFAAQPTWAEDLVTSNRYNAARVAALAGCGQGKDDPPLNEPTRARWREQALAWLRADLALWTKRLADAKPEVRTAVQQRLEEWQRDPDLAGLREEAALAKLPAAEQKTCRQFWADVQLLVKQIRSK
jgi:serine/threonine-protein kinase